MYKTIISAITIIASASVYALNLEEALTSAYDNNNELKSIRTIFLSEIEAFPQALAEFMPRGGASVESRETRTKGQSQFDRSPSSTNNNLQKSITIEQPLFNGGRSVAALKAAQSGFRSARGKYYASEQKGILDLISLYLDCYAAKEKYEISETSVKANQKQLESSEERLKLGEATVTEVASAKAGLAIAESDRLANYANFQAIKANFTRAFGVPPDDLTIPSMPNNLPISLDNLVEKSRITNPNIISTKHKAYADKANEFTKKATLLPSVSFRMQAGKNYFDPETQSLTGSNINSMSITSALSVQIPIFGQGGAEFSAIRNAKNQTRLSVIELDEKMKQNDANCIAIFEGYITARSRIEAATQASEAAEIAYEGTVQEEMVGSKTILDVLNAEDRLHKSKIDKVEANKSYLLAAYQMKALQGELTAKSLKLKVKYFEPEREFKKIKMKIIGF